MEEAFAYHQRAARPTAGEAQGCRAETLIPFSRKAAKSRRGAKKYEYSFTALRKLLRLGVKQPTSEYSSHSKTACSSPTRPAAPKPTTRTRLLYSARTAPFPQ